MCQKSTTFVQVTGAQWRMVAHPTPNRDTGSVPGGRRGCYAVTMGCLVALVLRPLFWLWDRTSGLGCLLVVFLLVLTPLMPWALLAVPVVWLVTARAA